ncbi:PucR family transcriptional regulator [Brevibacterium aurantiacum]|uniref:PucR family transcriptional regulator n=1 Tax=Brevibacterium aurantiacum TaxID=273384 RepID=UPI0018681D41|nr:helix-turn-helix domain-containing protein [Brevibacterium aurantiacum]
MRRLLRAGGDRADEIRKALHVVSAFDDLQRQLPNLTALAELASSITGHVVVIDDMLTRQRLQSTARLISSAEVSELSRRGMGLRSRGARTMRMDFHSHPVLVASVEHGEGRLGTVFLVAREGTEWRSQDELTLERLSQAVAVAALRSRDRRLSPGVRESLQYLFTRDLDGAEYSGLVETAGLDSQESYRALVAEEHPSQSASPHAVLSAIGNESSRYEAQSCIVGRRPVVVTSASEAESRVAEFHETVTESGRFSVRIGVGASVHPGELKRSFTEASESLRLGSSRAPTVWYEQLGVIGLLSTVSDSAISEQPDVASLIELQEQGKIAISDLDIVENYCETGSLRQTADEVHMHHSSVDYRLKQFQDLLSFPLRSQEGKLRALLAIRLARLGAD